MKHALKNQAQNSIPAASTCSNCNCGSKKDCCEKYRRKGVRCKKCPNS